MNAKRQYRLLVARDTSLIILLSTAVIMVVYFILRYFDSSGALIALLGNSFSKYTTFIYFSAALILILAFLGLTGLGLVIYNYLQFFVSWAAVHECATDGYKVMVTSFVNLVNDVKGTAVHECATGGYKMTDTSFVVS